MSKKEKIISILTFAITLCFALISTSQSAPPEWTKKSISSAFAPDEVIIKFNPQSSIGVSNDKKISTNGLTSDPDINKLFQKQRIMSIEKIFKHRQNIMSHTGLTSRQFFQQIQEKFPVRSKRVPPNTPTTSLDQIYKLKVPPDTDILRLCGEFQNNPNIAYAHPNYIYRTNFLPNDPFFSSSGSWGQSYDDLWGLKIIKGPDAWDYSSGQGVVVAVVDTGIDYNHQDIMGNVFINPGEDINHNGVIDPSDFNGIDDDGNGYIDDLRGWDFVSDNNNPIDDFGHGTHVSGTIAATGDNMIGVIGLSFHSRVMPVRALNAQGGGNADIAEAIAYAADNGADVINMSFAGPKSGLLKDAVDYAYSLGVVMVASAGNEYGNDSAYIGPAGFSTVITVASTDQSDMISNFSNIGVKIDVSAPGGGSTSNSDVGLLGINILSLRAAGTDMYGNGICVVDGDYYRSRGTSMAAPHVSALAALILSKHPTLNNEEVRQIIRTSADDIDAPGWDPNAGYGRVNAYKSILIESIPASKIILPQTNTNIGHGLVDIMGSAYSPDFVSYTVEYGVGLNPSAWYPINASTNPVSNDILARWDTTSLPMGDYLLRLTVNGAGRFAEDRVLAVIWAEPHAGFPVQLGDLNHVLTLSDIDHNGFEEIILDEPRSIDVYDFQGKPLPGWPLSFSNSWVASGISAADLDPSYDGEELAVVLLEEDDKYFLHLYHSDRTEIMTEHWPKLLIGMGANTAVGSFFGYAPILIDVDNDGELDIIMTTLDPSQSGPPYTTIIQAWHLDGTAVQGQWPRTVTVIIEDGYVPGVPSVGNVDNDPEMEIAIGGYDGQLHIFNHDGSYVSGWPKSIANNTLFSTTMADVNKDSRAEIIVPEQDGRIHIVTANGSEIPGWPYVPSPPFDDFPVSYNMPIAADLDQDGQLEVIMISDRALHVINHDGTIKDGWPKVLPASRLSGNYLNGVVGDIDGDYRQEIIITSSFPSAIYAFDLYGKPVEGFPIFLNGLFSLSSGGVSDLDRDGNREILAFTTSFVTVPSTLYAFDIPRKGEGLRLDWPMLRRDSRHTQALLPLGDVNGDWRVNNIDFLTIGKIINELSGFTKWRFPGGDVNQDGSVSVADKKLVRKIIQGRRVGRF